MMSTTHGPTSPGVTKQSMDGVSDAVEVALVHSHLFLRYLLLVVSGRFSWCQKTEKVAAFLAHGPLPWVPGSAEVLVAAVRVGETYMGKKVNSVGWSE